MRFSGLIIGALHIIIFTFICESKCHDMPCAIKSRTVSINLRVLTSHHSDYMNVRFIEIVSFVRASERVRARAYIKVPRDESSTLVKSSKVSLSWPNRSFRFDFNVCSLFIAFVAWTLRQPQFNCFRWLIISSKKIKIKTKMHENNTHASLPSDGESLEEQKHLQFFKIHFVGNGSH